MKVELLNQVDFEGDQDFGYLSSRNVSSNPAPIKLTNAKGMGMISFEDLNLPNLTYNKAYVSREYHPRTSRKNLSASTHGGT